MTTSRRFSDHIIVPSTAYNNMVFVKGWAERFPRATFWGLEGVNLPGAKFTKDLTMEVRVETYLETGLLYVCGISDFYVATKGSCLVF